MFTPLVISLPIENRQVSYDFYRAALSLEAIGHPAEDGIPEPLQFTLNSHVRLMLVPRGGFGWVVGEERVAERGLIDSLLSVEMPNEIAVRELFRRCLVAGAESIREPVEQPWGFQAVFADPDGHPWMILAAPDRHIGPLHSDTARE